MTQHNADEPQTGKDWSETEVRLIVVDYFDMLKSELLGTPYVKSHHRKELTPQLAGRTGSAVEYKHRNVSAVLVGLGLPYIDGYKPLPNLQSQLADQVESYLNENPEFLKLMETAPTLNPTEPKPATHLNFTQIIEPPPDTVIAPIAPDKPWLSRKSLRIDFVRRDATNRQLGKLGEQFVFELERHRLRLAGRDDLAEKVVWASRDLGDGLGFDILSFDEADETERMLEVKATGSGKFFPFYVTSNEVRCSEDIPAQYRLFRVFDFGRSPRLYILRGSLRAVCQLDPLLYRATV